jgi:phosphatidylserine/phosphatidylglycerophosphate/cardiolipin synthase-like enzyme
MDTFYAGDGEIELTFLQQAGANPFTADPGRAAQIAAVASQIARFISEATKTLDIAVYDMRLHDEAAAIIRDALRGRARQGVAIRIVYDATIDSGAEDMPAVPPAHVEADKKAPGTQSFVHTFADIAEIKGVRGFRVLMHSKYIVRDGASPEAAVFTGSANYTNDSWGLQENNLLCLRSGLLSSFYSRNFDSLISSGTIIETIDDRAADSVRIAGVPISVAFAPGQSPTIIKEIVGAITAARDCLYVASVVLSSGPILAALSEAIDRGVPLAGIYDGPQMDQVERQWKAAHVGADKINTWEKVARHLVRKNSIPYDRSRPHDPHNFMHNKLVIADEVVVTGSFNLSNHAMGNAENVLLMEDAGIASKYESYVRQLMTRYKGSTPA